MKAANQITQEKVRDYFTYWEGELFWNISRKSIIPGSIAGSLNKHGYYRIKVDQKEYKRSRLIWTYFNGEIPEGMLVDHKNNIRTDDQIDNLQLITKSDNIKKQLKSSNNTTGYKGVSYKKRDDAYEVRIHSNNETIYIGYFKDPIEAAIAYDNAAKLYHGKYAILNFPEEYHI